MADRPDNRARFLILGSASRRLVKSVSESLAGRVECVELWGFNLLEVPDGADKSLWGRGGFPRSFLAQSESEGVAWREGFIRTFLERDVPQFGIRIPAAAVRRFWAMLTLCHSQTWKHPSFGTDEV